MRCWYVPDTEAYRTRFEMGAKTAPAAVLLRLCAENEAALLLFVKELQLKGFSRRTIVMYRNEPAQLLQTPGRVPVNSLRHSFATHLPERELTSGI